MRRKPLEQPATEYQDAELSTVIFVSNLVKAGPCKKLEIDYF